MSDVEDAKAAFESLRALGRSAEEAGATLRVGGERLREAAKTAEEVAAAFRTSTNFLGRSTLPKDRRAT